MRFPLTLKDNNQLQSGQSFGTGLLSQFDPIWPTNNNVWSDSYGNTLNGTSPVIGVNPSLSLPQTLLSANTASANIPFQYRSGTLTGSYPRFTACIWFLATALPASFYGLLSQNSSTNGFTLLWSQSSGKLEIWTAAGSFTGTPGTTVLATNTWYCGVGVYDGTNRLVYLNGVQEATAVASFTAVTSPAMVIGGDPTNAGRGLTGWISRSRFYSRALSAEEINAMYYSDLQSIFGTPEELMPPWAIPVAAPASNVAWFVNSNALVQGVAS
jgi:hypothetical protein